jgi:CopG family transcriptional regulator, nickel-responsive regulator
MGELSRIGIALDSDLLAKFAALIESGYTNRSEAFRDLIRAELLQKSLESPASRVIGTLTLVYDHHVRLLQEKLTELQHQHHHSILSTLHIHLDHDHCLEVVVVSGKLAELQALADTLTSTKGVKHGQANWTVTAAELKQHQHRH